MVVKYFSNKGTVFEFRYVFCPLCNSLLNNNVFDLIILPIDLLICQSSCPIFGLFSCPIFSGLERNFWMV